MMLLNRLLSMGARRGLAFSAIMFSLTTAAAPTPELHFDFPGIRVGVAEYEAGPTGATVIAFDQPVKAAVDVRGGAPGTVNTDALRLGYDAPTLSAVTLAGGSSYGLEVAAGVADALKEQTSNAGAWQNIQVVAGAIIFDLGGRRYTTVTPDAALGREALKAARPGVVPLGTRGAGRFAMHGYYYGDLQHSGQGAAFRQVGAVKVLVVTVVNALGTVVDRSGRVVRCARPGPAGCGLAQDLIAGRLRDLGERDIAPVIESHAGLTSNTTISLVITNEALPVSALQRLAVQVHNSMSRAIQPFGTESDGDTLFAVTTGEVTQGGLAPVDLGVLASETAWDAVLASQPVLPAELPRVTQSLVAGSLHAYAGMYELAPGSQVCVTEADGALVATATGADSIYFPVGRGVRLRYIGNDRFEMATHRGDVIEFVRSGSRSIDGLTINPGPWPIRARRVDNHR